MNRLHPCILLATLSIGTATAQCNAPANESGTLPDDAACAAAPPGDDKIHLHAQRSSRVDDERVRFSGRVCIAQENMRLQTPALLFNRSTRTFDSEGPIRFSDGTQSLWAETGHIDSAARTAQFSALGFTIADSEFNGEAETMRIADERTYIDELLFTSCPPQQRDWRITAKSAELNHERGTGTFRGAKVYFKKMPLFYFPRVTLPLNDDRRSGFLVPDLAFSDRTGLDFSLPYYFNIRPNVDLTLTPRFLQHHGLMLAAELRYLSAASRGELFASFLPDDDRRGRNRTRLIYDHRTRINPNWSFSSNLDHVSDSQYFEDFSSNSLLASTPYLKSSVRLNGQGRDWTFYLTADDFQVISDQISPSSEPYQRLPEAGYNWQRFDLRSKINYGLRSQWVNFHREDSLDAWRSDVQPFIERKFANAWGWVTPRYSWRHTHYRFDDERDSITRDVPIYSIDAGLTFEKWHDSGAHNTLEPRVFYAYVPDRRQDDIPLFDTHELTFGSALLFETNRFSGADRQGDMNQLSTALTHRSFDAQGQEKWNFTLGQIQYFETLDVQLSGAPEQRDRSPLIAEYNHNLPGPWQVTLSMHYDEVLNETERALVRLQRKKNSHIFNLAYRLRRDKIEQVDASLVIPMNERHRWLARWNYSLLDDKTIEALFGYEYKSCCWATRVMARHYIIDETGQSNNGIYLELQLNGLGSIGRNPRRVLRQSIRGYTEEF